MRRLLCSILILLFVKCVYSQSYISIVNDHYRSVVGDSRLDFEGWQRNPHLAAENMTKLRRANFKSNYRYSMLRIGLSKFTNDNYYSIQLSYESESNHLLTSEYLSSYNYALKTDYINFYSNSQNSVNQRIGINLSRSKIFLRHKNFFSTVGINFGLSHNIYSRGSRIIFNKRINKYFQDVINGPMEITLESVKYADMAQLRIMPEWNIGYNYRRWKFLAGIGMAADIWYFYGTQQDENFYFMPRMMISSHVRTSNDKNTLRVNPNRKIVPAFTLMYKIKK